MKRAPTDLPDVTYWRSKGEIPAMGHHPSRPLLAVVGGTLMCNPLTQTSRSYNTPMAADTGH